MIHECEPQTRVTFSFKSTSLSWKRSLTTKRTSLSETLFSSLFSLPTFSSTRIINLKGPCFHVTQRNDLRHVLPTTTKSCFVRDSHRKFAGKRDFMLRKLLNSRRELLRMKRGFSLKRACMRWWWSLDEKTMTTNSRSLKILLSLECHETTSTKTRHSWSSFRVDARQIQELIIDDSLDSWSLAKSSWNERGFFHVRNETWVLLLPKKKTRGIKHRLMILSPSRSQGITN